MCIDYQTVLFLYRRASYPVYLKYHINKLELQLLIMLSAFLRSEDRKIVSKSEFFGTVTNNSREKLKMEGYLKGCIDKRFIGCYEYISHPGSLSIGLSELGINVLQSFETDLNKLQARYQVKRPLSLLSLAGGIGQYIPKVAA